MKPHPEDLHALSPEQLVAAFSAPAKPVRQAAFAEACRRLRRNKTNWHFFRYLAAFWSGDEDTAADAYQNLQRMAFAYLHEYHTPRLAVRWNPKQAVKMSSDWDMLFHETLFGDGLKKHGEFDRYCDIGWERHLVNALYNRYSGILTRVGQRRKDEWRRQELEFPQVEVENDQLPRGSYDPQELADLAVWNPADPTADNSDAGEYAIGFEKSFGKAHAVYDTENYMEHISDSRYHLGGLDGIGYTGNLFLNPVETFEWTCDNLPSIKREAGETAMWTWSIIIRWLKDNPGVLDGATPAQAHKDILAHLAAVEGIGKKAAAKRIRQLSKSDTIRSWLTLRSEKDSRWLPPAPTAIPTGKSRRRRHVDSPGPATQRRKPKPGCE